MPSTAKPVDENLSLASAPAASDPSNPSGTGPRLRRILVVDDEPPILWLLQEGLAELPDCEVVTAASGEQALQFLAAGLFDLMITDYKMPGLDGLEVARRARQLHPQLLMVMLTAYGNLWLSKQAAELSIRHVLNKPVKLTTIRDLVSTLLAMTG